MPRFIQYDEAVSILTRLESLTVDELRRALDISPQAAASFLRRFADEGLIEMQDEAAQRYRILGRSRRRWGATSIAPPPRDGHDAAGPAAEIARLQRELAAMRERAANAEARAASGGSHARADDATMHDRLRRVLVRSLHPDAQTNSEEARRVMDELFRTLWPKVKRILDGKPEDDLPDIDPRTPAAQPWQGGRA